VQESPTIYSVFLQENQKDTKSEKDQPAVVRPSISAGAVMLGTNKRNVQVNKKAPEKKDKQYTLEDALQQAWTIVFVLLFSYLIYILCKGFGLFASLVIFVIH